MSKPEADKRKSAGVQVAKSPTADPQPESLDKVRDILFGGQMRAVETRLQGMEERLRQEHDALRSEFGKQTKSLDTLIRAEVQSLSERLAAERAKRAEELKSLAAEIKEALRALEKRHVKLEEAANMADAALRDQLFLQSAEASAALTKLGERLTAELSRSHQELQSTKTDRATLAALLTDVAARLSGAPGSAVAPGKNGPRS
jgi:DNA repair exonuclease SbcCD ATPase subunit